MHNSPPQSPPTQSAFTMDDPSTSIWDWSQFLDFNIEDHLPLPSDDPPIIPIYQELDNSIDDDLHLQHQQQVVIDSSNNNNGRVRKRDPRMACSNFLAGRIPCACPELDAQLAAEEEEQAAPGKKRTRTVTASSRCQVPGCEVDISELKGYHKRHRVCLRCATATTVVLDGTNKRYCQQCGKFHLLSDFDEGKRSCRRKLERHNNRRRRKPSDNKESGLQSADYDDGYDETGKGAKAASSELAGEKLFLATDRHNTLPSSIQAQNIQSDGIPSLAVSGETQTDEEKEKETQSPSYCDDKSAYSSMCVTGRISFKLYDWNPAEFPRRLRHQIFQWLASMPVELEGYIRPGCTILTIFIAMPRFMWVKLSEDPAVSIREFLASPKNLLSGRDTFFVNLNSMIFSVMKGGSSVIKIKAGERSPKLHYIQPTCFEAGKPIEFLACGSNLLQPRLRFLLSFAGKYMANDVRVSPLSKNTNSTTNSDHQFLNICAPRTELDVFGPGFIEVENESGLSNFIPILVADEEVCSEIKILQMKYYSTLHSRNSESTSISSSCEVAVSRFSELLVDIAWLIKQPIVEDMESDMMSSELHRFIFVINFLIEYESTTMLKRVLQCVKMRIVKSGGDDGTLLQETLNHATEVLNQRLVKKVNLGLHPRDNLEEEDDDENYRDELLPFISTINQDTHKSETIALLNADCVMSVTPYKELPEKSSTRVCTYYNTNRLFTPRPLILAVALVAVCFGICAVVFHPQKASAIAITIRRCLFDDK